LGKIFLQERNYMKNRWLLFLFLTLFVFAGCGVKSDKGKKIEGPIIFVKDHTFDAGKVDEGTKIYHTFKIENKGNAPLKIIGVAPT
jgi:hypothetical protein